MANTRFAVLALPYAMQELGYPKEIMCDYVTGHFYVKTEDGLQTLSITKELETELQKLRLPTGGDIIGVSVDGMQENTLNAILTEFRTKIMALSQGLSVKGPAEAICTVDVTRYGIPGPIDGVVLTEGQRILLIGQTNKIENGIWIVKSTDWIRSIDFDESTEVSNTPYIFIENGTIYQETGWIMTTNDPIIGTTGIEFQQFTGMGLIKSGTGIVADGNKISLKQIFETEQFGSSVIVDIYGRIKSVSNVISGFTTNRVLISAGDTGVVTSSSISTSELNTLNGATSNIQEQLNSKNSFDISTQLEAEAGADNVKGMTPLRVKQFLIANSDAMGGYTNVVYQSGKKYWKYTATEATTTIVIPVEFYNPLTDSLEAIQNSNIPLSASENYTLANNTFSLLNYSLEINETIHFLITNTSYDYNSLANRPNIINDLVTGGPTSLLSAEQGKLINEKINALILQNNLIVLTGYIHDQIAASDLWVITHNMNKYPSVTIVDSAGNVISGDITYISSNQLTISFTSDFSGKAYLN